MPELRGKSRAGKFRRFRFQRNQPRQENESTLVLSVSRKIEPLCAGYGISNGTPSASGHCPIHRFTQNHRCLPHHFRRGAERSNDDDGIPDRHEPPSRASDTRASPHAPGTCRNHSGSLPPLRRVPPPPQSPAAESTFTPGREDESLSALSNESIRRPAQSLHNPFLCEDIQGNGNPPGAGEGVSRVGVSVK